MSSPGYEPPRRTPEAEAMRRRIAARLFGVELDRSVDAQALRRVADDPGRALARPVRRAGLWVAGVVGLVGLTLAAWC